MAALFFSVTVTSMKEVFEGPVWTLARNRMKNSAAMQYKNVGHRSRIIGTLLGCNIITFENFESELFQTPVVCSAFKNETSLICFAFSRYLSP